MGTNCSPPSIFGTAAETLPCASACVLLDIEHDRVLRLNAVAAEIWELLCAGEAREGIASAIAAKYGIDLQRVSCDINSFVDRLSGMGLKPRKIETADFVSINIGAASALKSYPWYGQRDNGPPASAWSVVLAFVGLLSFDFILSICSLKALCRCVHSWPQHKKSFGADTVAQICSAVQSACTWYPKKTVCLQRSAVTTCLLRVKGVPARMIIGVRALPFVAHAWVEVDGFTVNDWPTVKKFYSAVSAQ